MKLQSKVLWCIVGLLGGLFCGCSSTPLVTTLRKLPEYVEPAEAYDTSARCYVPILEEVKSYSQELHRQLVKCGYTVYSQKEFDMANPEAPDFIVEFIAYRAFHEPYMGGGAVYAQIYVVVRRPSRYHPSLKNAYMSEQPREFLAVAQVLTKAKVFTQRDADKATRLAIKNCMLNPAFREALQAPPPAADAIYGLEEPAVAVSDAQLLEEPNTPSKTITPSATTPGGTTPTANAPTPLAKPSPEAEKLYGSWKSTTRHKIDTGITSTIGSTVQSYTFKPDGTLASVVIEQLTGSRTKMDYTYDYRDGILNIFTNGVPYPSHVIWKDDDTFELRVADTKALERSLEASGTIKKASYTIAPDGNITQIITNADGSTMTIESSPAIYKRIK